MASDSISEHSFPIRTWQECEFPCNKTWVFSALDFSNLSWKLKVKTRCKTKTRSKRIWVWQPLFVLCYVILYPAPPHSAVSRLSAPSLCKVHSLEPSPRLLTDWARPQINGSYYAKNIIQREMKQACFLAALGVLSAYCKPEFVSQAALPKSAIILNKQIRFWLQAPLLIDFISGLSS